MVEGEWCRWRPSRKQQSLREAGHLELHSARGQAVIAESVVSQVVDQPVHILGERGQVLEGMGTAAAWPHPAPHVTHPPTSTSTPGCARAPKHCTQQATSTPFRTL